MQLIRTLISQAMHTYGIPGREVMKAGNVVIGRTIGVFKCDVGLVYAANGKYCRVLLCNKFNVSYTCSFVFSVAV